MQSQRLLNELNFIDYVNSDSHPSIGGYGGNDLCFSTLRFFKISFTQQKLFCRVKVWISFTFAN